MGEKSDMNFTLYMDNGEGYTPLGEIKEVSFDSGEDAYIPLDLTGTMTITFKPMWRSKLKTWWMLTVRWPLKRLFCKHHWVMHHMIEEKEEADGHFHSTWACYCPRCGKWKNRRYSRWTKPRD